MNEHDRIELLMKSYNLSPSQFADRTGIQRASVSHILSGRNKPSLEVMLKIYDAFPGLSMEWLMAGVGEGPMDAVPEQKEDKEVVNQSSIGLFGDFNDVPVVEISSGVNGNIQESVARKSRIQSEKARKENVSSLSVEKSVRKASQTRSVAQTPVLQRKIKEVRIFYTDGTYETLVPEK